MILAKTRERDGHSTRSRVAARQAGRLSAARTRDMAAAEDALSEAFAAALEHWPVSGCPANPEAWLLTVARRKLIDNNRRKRNGEVAAGQLLILGEGLNSAGMDAEFPDQRLALMFTCAHPAIEAAIRAPLMLQTVLGQDAKMIASAFLMSPAAMGKRLVRTKNKIREAGISFAIPERGELAGRLDAVLEAIYAAFSEGWTDPGGTDAARRELTGKPYIWPGLWLMYYRRNRRRWACCRFFCIRRPGGAPAATRTATSFPLARKISRCGIYR